MKVILKNSKLVFANLNGELIYDGNLTQVGKYYNYNIGSIVSGERYKVFISANFPINAQQQLSMYLKDASSASGAVCSNVADMMGLDMTIERTFDLTASSNNSDTNLTVFTLAEGWTKVVFHVKIYKMND